MKPVVIILAAGQGRRMHSDRPKVLHPVGGQPMLAHVIATAQSLDANHCIVVVGHGGQEVTQRFSHDTTLTWVTQARQLGTGHAVAQALEVLPDVPLHVSSDQGVAVVLYGDVPLVRAATVQPLIAQALDGALGLLTVELTQPTGYGRIVRNAAGHVQAIVEEKDATTAQRAIREVNTGILAAPLSALRRWVQQLRADNAQHEYYLTDVIALAVHEGIAVSAFQASDSQEVLGINDRRQLAAVEKAYQIQQANNLLAAGVTLCDPNRVDIRGQVTTGMDVTLDIDVILEGQVQLGHRVRIGPYCYLRDCQIADDVEILSHSRIEEAVVESGARIGPYARLRPGTHLRANVHIGNFVEIKQAVIDQNSKVNHLTYIGDAEIGQNVNVGAGTITCNYDGANKHKTIIEDEVFIGSNTALVAPVRIGHHATIGAGSTINKDVLPNALALTRAAQKTFAHWVRPVKKSRS